MTDEKLSSYERRVFEARILADQPMTLEELAAEFGVARVRVWQLEARALDKIASRMKRSTETADQTILALEKVFSEADDGSEPEELVEAVRIAMLELPFRMRSSEEHLALTLKVWADAVRDYPLWAVRKAAKWWSRGARDGDELRHFLADVRLAATCLSANGCLRGWWASPTGSYSSGFFRTSVLQ
jgi:Sigma-70, region 4